MVTALLRALGFDDEGAAPPGEGQDRAPVGSGQDVPEDVTQARQRATRDAAQPWLGTQYRLGGNDQRAVDCSGLVNALLRGFGAQIPGRPSTTTYRDQLAAPIDWKVIQPGDVLISPANRADPVSGEHMALYVGGGQMVEASGTAGQVRYSDVTNRNLQPYRLREPVPGLQQVTLLAQREGDVPQAAPPAQGAAAGGAAPAGPASVQRIAMTAGASPDVAEIMAAGAKTENPSLNPTGPAGDGGQSVGLWQLHAGGAGHGMSVEARQDPQTAANRIAPDYMTAYQQGQQRGFQGADLATYTYIHAERPSDNPRGGPLATMNGPVAQRFRANYTEVSQQSARGNELQVGGGYAPPSGAPGQATAGGAPNLAQQAFAAAQPVIQQLLAQAGGAAEAVGGAVANLGATPAHAEALPAGPPPGPTPQVQQPPPGTPPPPPAPSATGTPTPAVQPTPAPAPPPTPAPGAPSSPAPTPTPSLGTPQATTPGRAQSNIPPGYTPPSQGPAPGTTPAPAGPPPAAPAPSTLPPDTATEHWDNTIRAWVPKPPAATFPGGGRYRITPGVETATDERGNPAPNPPGTPVEYVPIQAGYYDTPQGRQYWDSTTQQWHQPTGQAATQGTPSQPLAPGLSFVPSAPNSRAGTVYWEDPNTHAVTQAPYTLGDPMPAGLGQPQPAPPTPMSEYQRVTSGQAATQNDTANQQWWADYQQRVANTDSTNALAQQRLTQEAQQHADTLAVQRRGQSTPTQVGPDIWGPDPNNPDPNAPFVNLGPAGQTPSQEAATAASQAQTRRLTQESTLPTVVNHRVYAPVTNPDTGASSYQDTGPESMSASEQSLADYRQQAFSTLSAEQQTQADQAKASLAQNESQFQQNLAEKQAESARPYSQMTKAEQAQNQIQQAQLGLDTQKLGLQENQAANQLENLPRGGIMRVDPFTGQSSLVNAPEPEDIRMVGSQIYIPGGRQVSMLGSQITGGPNPYAGVPTGGGGMFQYPGAQGGQASPYQNWGGQGGGGWGGGMSSSPGWAPPQQQRQGWMGSGY